MAELTEAQLLQSIWMALRRIEDNLSLPPAPLELPPITVTPPDLTDIVTAVTSLNGTGPTAEDIASAIASVISPVPASSDGAEALHEVAATLEKLDYRLKGMGAQAYGGGSVNFAPGEVERLASATQSPDVTDRAGRLLGQVSVTSALPAGTNNIGYTGTVPGQQVALGRFFLSSTGRISLTAAGNFRAIVQNPAASGKTISIARLAAFATGAGYATIWLNPTVGVPPTAVRPITNAVLGGGLASVTQLRADTDLTVALSGGTETGLVFGIPGAARTSLDLPPLVLTQGQTMGLNVPFAGAADVTMSLYWWETPA